MTTKAQIKIWGLPVRVFHWSLVLLFTIDFYSEGEFLTIHLFAGYTLVALIVFRIIWGFVGRKHERFSDFVFTPATVIAYAKDIIHKRPKRYLGHNPVGGAMVIALLISISITIITGVMILATIEKSGILVRLMNLIPFSIFNPIAQTHSFFSNFTAFLIGLHIIGVVVASFTHKENLIRSMITGKKDSE